VSTRFPSRDLNSDPLLFATSKILLGTYCFSPTSIVCERFNIIRRGPVSIVFRPSVAIFSVVIECYDALYGPIEYNDNNGFARPYTTSMFSCIRTYKILVGTDFARIKRQKYNVYHAHISTRGFSGEPKVCRKTEIRNFRKSCVRPFHANLTRLSVRV